MCWSTLCVKMMQRNLTLRRVHSENRCLILLASFWEKADRFNQFFYSPRTDISSLFFSCECLIWVELNLYFHCCQTVLICKQNMFTGFGLPLFRHCSMVLFVNSCTFLYFCIKLSINWLAWRGVIPRQSARRSLPGGKEMIFIMQ